MGFFRKYVQKGFWENRQMIRKFVIIFIHVGASGLSIFFIAVKHPWRRDLW